MPPADDAQPEAQGSLSSPAVAPEPVAATRLPSLGLFWAIGFAVVVFDQVTKALVTDALPLYGSRPLISGFVDLVHVQNAGVAFGLFNDVDHPMRQLFTISLALVALVGIAYYARHLRPEERLARTGLALILGGAVGNLIDRVRQGFVTDFIDAYWGNWHFWAFNAADAAITTGAILILLELAVSGRQAVRSA